MPSGLGVQGEGFVLVCGLFGIDGGTALALSLAKRVPDVVLGLPALLIWQNLEARRSGIARRGPAMIRFLFLLTGLLLASPASPRASPVDLGAGGTTERALQLVALITVLAVAPSVLVMATAFTRIVVVLSILRSALGTQTAPPTAVIISLALFLTAFVMAPTGREAYTVGIEPLIAGRITQAQAFERASAPFKAFMLKNVREKDLKLFLDLAKAPVPKGPEDVGLEVVTPAFMISELRRAFEIGFLLFIPS